MRSPAGVCDDFEEAFPAFTALYGVSGAHNLVQKHPGSIFAQRRCHSYAPRDAHWILLGARMDSFPFQILDEFFIISNF